MAKMRPEDTFLTIALSVIGVGAIAAYLAIIAPTYDKEDRIPSPEEYALSAKNTVQETDASTDTLSAGTETERIITETPVASSEIEASKEADAVLEPSGLSVPDISEPQDEI